MKQPDAERAIVDERKLRDYCLNPVHPRGRHKAKRFASVLGLRQQNSDILREALLNAAVQGETVLGERDQFGQRYVLDFEMQGPMGSASVRSTWIVLAGEDFPRMTSGYLL